MCSVKTAFEKMEIGHAFEDFDEAITWLGSKQSIFPCLDIFDKFPKVQIEVRNAINNNILYSSQTPDLCKLRDELDMPHIDVPKWHGLDGFERGALILKLSETVRKHEKLFSQLETISRGILSKDTKSKALPMLADYLQYYSSAGVKYDEERCKSKNVSVKNGGVLFTSDTDCLSILGSYLGPVLAKGDFCILSLEPKISLSAALLIELATNIGIPEGVIIAVPGYFNERMVYRNTIFDIRSPGISMVVFDDADLDSASDCAIDAAWGYQGMLPWSVKSLLVQENVHDQFVAKLKRRLRSVNVGQANDKNADITWPRKEGAWTQLKHNVETAIDQGIEVFQIDHTFSPTLLIGGNVNNTRQDFAVNIVAFRNTNEAVSLVNNSENGIAASVWTENLGLANEVIKKLQVSNIWINSHGLFAADLSIFTYKKNEGFLDGFRCHSLDNKLLKIDENIVHNARRAQKTWVELSKFDRNGKLQHLADNLRNNRRNLSVSEHVVDKIVKKIYSCLSYVTGSTRRLKDYTVISFKEPKGVVCCLYDESDLEDFLIQPLIEGNAVIFIIEQLSGKEFFKYLSNYLPNNLLIAIDKPVQNCTGNYIHLPVADKTEFSTIKNAWLNVGHSFI